MDTHCETEFDISVCSSLIKLSGYVRKRRLDNYQIKVAHMCVLENCREATYYVEQHAAKFFNEFPDSTHEERIDDFNSYFSSWMASLQNEGSSYYNPELHNLACGPQTHKLYSQCNVNGVKFLIWERDIHLKTQNSGVMVEAGELEYYGIVEEIIELKYVGDMTVVVFKCKWFNTDPSDRGSTKLDHGLLSVDTSTSWYDDAPYCLAITAKQAFYLDDPRAEDNWKVVNVVTQRGIYSDTSLARDESNPQNTLQPENPYQENTSRDIPTYDLEYDLPNIPDGDTDDDGDNEEEDVGEEEDEFDHDE